MPETTVDQTADHLLALKRSRSAHQRLQSTLTLLLVFALIFTWKSTLPLLKNVDQLRNDLKEKQQLIQMEEKNLEALKKLADDDEVLDEHLNMLYAALPPADEKAEDMISMLENIAAQNRMVIDGIGIRKLSESQINYDDLLGVVDIYEYSFTLESAFENISSFLRDLRSSLRLMDVMAMEVEENKGLYRANFILHAYHLTPY